MKVQKKSRTTFFTDKTLITSWISSYVIIVSVPILLSSFLFLHSLHYMQVENEKLCQSELRNLSSIMDSYLLEMDRVALEFSMDPQAISLATAKTHTNQEHYTYYEVQQRMKYYTVSNSNISRMGILFMDKDTVLTDSSTLPLSHAKEKLLDSQLIEYLSQGKFQNHYYYLSGSETFVHILSLPYYANSVSNCYLFITLNPETWHTICENQKENIFQVTIDNGGDLDASALSSENLTSDDFVLYQASQLSPISYSLIFRNSETAQHIRSIQLVIVFCSIVCILISIFLVYYFTKKHYTPLLQLVKKTTPDFSRREGNEFHILEKHIDSIQKENSTLEQELLKTHAITEEIYLVKLVQVTYSQEEYRQIAGLPIWQQPEEKEELNLAILVFSIDDTSQTQYSGDEDDTSLIRFIIKNILGDLIDPNLRWQSVYLDEKLLVIIHGHHSVLNQTCSAITTQMPPLLNTFSLRTHIGVSIGCKPLPQVHLLYKEAQKALEHCCLFDTAYTVFQDKIDTQAAAAKNAQTVIKVQYKFQNALLTQNYETAIQMLPDLFADSFSEEQTISLLRLNMYALVNLYRSCLLKLSEKNSYLLSIMDDQIASLLNCVSLDALQKEFLCCLQELKTQKSSQFLSKQELLIEEVKEYIEIHYSDNTLSAGQVADYFQTPLSTISKLFKKYTNMGMLDYIHHVRINQAKALLKAKKYTVNEVASMTGYLSASTFIRIFKKYEGISPGTLMDP